LILCWLSNNHLHYNVKKLPIQAQKALYRAKHGAMAAGIRGVGRLVAGAALPLSACELTGEMLHTLHARNELRLGQANLRRSRELTHPCFPEMAQAF